MKTGRLCYFCPEIKPIDIAGISSSKESRDYRLPFFSINIILSNFQNAGKKQSESSQASPPCRRVAVVTFVLFAFPHLTADGALKYILHGNYDWLGGNKGNKDIQKIFLEIR